MQCSIGNPTNLNSKDRKKRMGSRMLGNMNTRRQDISTHCHTVFVVSATAAPTTVLGAVTVGADGTLGILGILAHDNKGKRIKYLIVLKSHLVNDVHYLQNNHIVLLYNSFLLRHCFVVLQLICFLNY